MLWQQKVNELRGPRKNSHIYQEVAAEMQEQGYDINSSSVKMKIDNLTSKYRKTSYRDDWGLTCFLALYEQVHQIIGGFSINNVEHLIEESFEDSISLSPINTYIAAATFPSPAVPLSVCSSPLHLGSITATLSSTSTSTAERLGKQKQMEQLVAVCEGIPTNFSEAMENVSKSTEELVELEKAKLVAMQGLQKDAKRLTDGVLDFLNTILRK